MREMIRPTTLAAALAVLVLAGCAGRDGGTPVEARELPVVVSGSYGSSSGFLGGIGLRF